MHLYEYDWHKFCVSAVSLVVNLVETLISGSLIKLVLININCAKDILDMPKRKRKETQMQNLGTDGQIYGKFV